MSNLIKLLSIFIILFVLFPNINGNILNNDNEFKIETLGSPGPIVAKFLEFYAIISNKYFIQERWTRDFEIHRQIINNILNESNVVIVDDEGDGNFTVIQDAINYCKPNDVILVYSGNYNDSIIIDKPVTIFGIGYEYKNGDNFGEPIINVFNENHFNNNVVINSDNVVFTGFKLISYDVGIKVLNFSNYIHLSYNKIFIQNNSTAIEVSCNNSYINNNILYTNKSISPGIIIENTSFTHFQNNIIENFGFGFVISNSNDNEFLMNSLKNNFHFGIYLKDGIVKNNTFSLNNFDNNTINAFVNLNEHIINNLWNSHEFGNYWDDYHIEDVDNNGIGDKPYITSDGRIIDIYPIITPFKNNPPDKPIINPDEIGILCLKTGNIIPVYVYFNDIDQDELNYVIFLGDNSIYNNDLIESDTVVEINNIWNSTGNNLVTIFEIQVIAFDEYFHFSISDPYEIHVYDLSNMQNIKVRNILDNLIPSYFLTNWN